MSRRKPAPTSSAPRVVYQDGAARIEFLPLDREYIAWFDTAFISAHRSETAARQALAEYIIGLANDGLIDDAAVLPLAA